jgi:hypothetical protein
MATVHNEIDNWLAADLHGDLSDAERSALHAHLVDCAACRKTHQETKLMDKILEETLAQEKPGPGFEQRMLAGFRRDVRARPTLIELPIRLLRSRILQFAAATALLIATGSWLTGVRFSFLGNADQLMEAMTRDERYDDSLRGLRDRLSWAEQKLELRRERASARATINAPSASQPARIEGFPEQQSKLAADQRAQPAATVGEGQGAEKTEQPGTAEVERVIATGSLIPTAEEVSAPPTNAALANRKLIRNATVDLEIASFDDAVTKITAFANEEKGYVATTSSEKQENGKLKGEIVVKVMPENLDRFLQKIRGLGELKNQTLGTEDVTKAYFDTDARLKNARVMEQRLIDMLKTKTGKVSDLLQVERELGRVREEIEKMQGELKYWDSQVQFATVTISLAEKDMEEPAAFLLKERSQLALYAPDVEKIYNDIKALASQKIQITNAQLNRDYSGRVSATMSMLIVPEESDSVISRVKGFGRVENFQTHTERIAQGGEGMSENAKTKRAKVELNITISREEQEQAFQQTTLRIRTFSVDEKSKDLRALAEKQGGRIRSSTFSRDPDGREFANVSLRVPMKNYQALMESLNALGKVENVSVQRQDRTGTQIEEANAPADISIQVYSQGNIVSHESGLFAALRRTLAQSAGAIMWSLRMIGVAVAFLAPWVIAIVAIVWVTRRILRARQFKS